MSLRINDPKDWRGRSQLQGKAIDGNVVYVNGPKVGRWTWDSSKNSLLASLELDVYGAPLKSYDAIRDKRNQLKNGGKLTPAGVNDEVSKLAAIATPTIARAKETLAKVTREVADRRAKIKPIAATSQDPIREMKKTRALSVIDRMSRSEVVSILAGPNPDPLFVEAVLEADPRTLPNVGPTLRKHLETVAVQSRHGAEIAELEEIERAIETSARALKTAEEGIGREIKGQDDPQQPSAPLFFRSA
jgi:hypothetical protein